MTADRALLARYLRQLRDAGETELLLETLDAQEAHALVSASVNASASGSASASGIGSGSASANIAPSAPPSALTSSSPSPSALALATLATTASTCTDCRLHEGRTSVVFGEGNSTADIMVVGEAPGAEEDRTGRPFVGPAGKLLDLLLLSVGFQRSQVYICNVLKCRPPGNRDPQADEVARCSPYLRQQIELIAPKAIVAVGKFAAQTLSSSQQPIGRLRGRLHRYEDVPLIATFHPAFLLRSPQWIPSAWQDFQLLRQVVDEQV